MTRLEVINGTSVYVWLKQDGTEAEVVLIGEKGLLTEGTRVMQQARDFADARAFQQTILEGEF